MFNWLKKKKTTIKMIVAIDENNGIGYQGDLLYKIKQDMQYFVEKTGTDPVIMRRGTFESFGAKPLPRRTNIVITRNPDYGGNGAIIASSLKAALKHVSKSNVAWVIGGAGLYVEALPIASELHLTQIAGTKPADTFFPEFKNTFHLISESKQMYDEKNDVWFTFQTWQQKKRSR